MPSRKKLKIEHYLSGNPSKKMSKKLLQVSGLSGLGEPFIPEHLNDDARGCIQLIKHSMPSQVYSTLDTFLLAAFALAWSIHKRAALEISNPDFEWVEQSENGMQHQSPWIRIVNEQSKVLVMLAGRLGLDPVVRDSMQAAGSQPKSDFDGLLMGQQVTYTRDDDTKKQ